MIEWAQGNQELTEPLAASSFLCSGWPVALAGYSTTLHPCPSTPLPTSLIPPLPTISPVPLPLLFPEVTLTQKRSLIWSLEDEAL